MSEENQVKAILCPNCGKLISGTADACMHCGTKNPNLWGMASTMRKFFGQTSLVPYIATACITLYVLSILLNPSAAFKGGGGILGFLSPSGQVLYKLGMTGSYALSNGRWWTLITAIYLHGSILHIAFNVLWIRQLGPWVEEFYGISRSFLIFTISGVIGFILSSYGGHVATLGASGSIFGLLGALIYYGRKRGGSFGSAIYRQMGQWALVLFIFGFIFPNIDNYAHAGGFIGGYLSANVLGFIEEKREVRSHQVLSFGAIAITVLAFLLTLFK